MLLAGKTAKQLHLAALKPVSVARGSARMAAAGSAKVTLKFASKARKALRARRSVSLVLRVTGANTAGNAPTLNRRVKLRR
jgi:hypothetical protein